MRGLRSIEPDVELDCCPAAYQGLNLRVNFCPVPGHSRFVASVGQAMALALLRRIPSPEAAVFEHAHASSKSETTDDRGRFCFGAYASPARRLRVATAGK